ncbi:MAG: Spy/CpxP family protein refolding chaperone [Spirulinaceae cyanobacterium]
MNWRAFSIIALGGLIVPMTAFAAIHPELHNAGAESSQLIAQNPQGENKSRNSENGPPWLQELNLTTEQSERIKAIHQESKESSQGLREQMKAAKEQMQTLMANGASSQQLQQQHQQMQSLHQQLSDRRFEVMLKVNEVLTPEQRSQLAQLKEQRRGENRPRGPRPEGD